MDCKKAQSFIPDLCTNNLSGGRKKNVTQHLAECESCQQWLTRWDQICDLGYEVSLPPAHLDWEPFNKAIEAELQRTPYPGRRNKLRNFWESLTHGLFVFPKTSHIRLATALAAIVFVLYISSHLQFQQAIPEAGNLTIGDFLNSSQQGETILYEQGETGKIFYYEEIRTETLEGKGFIL